MLGRSAGSKSAPRGATLSDRLASLGITPYVPTLISVKVKPRLLGRALTPHSESTCIQLRSYSPRFSLSRDSSVLCDIMPPPAPPDIVSAPQFLAAVVTVPHVW